MSFTFSSFVAAGRLTDGFSKSPLAKTFGQVWSVGRAFWYVSERRTSDPCELQQSKEQDSTSQTPCSTSQNRTRPTTVVMDDSLISTSSGSCNVRSPLRKEQRLDTSLDAHALCVLQEQLRTPSQADDSHFGRSSIIDESSVVSDSFNEVDLLRARMRADRAAAKAAQSEVQYLEAQRAESLRGSGSERSRSTKGGKPPSSTTTGGHTDPNPPLMRGENAMLMGESHTHEAKAVIVHSADRKDGIMPQYFARPGTISAPTRAPAATPTARADAAGLLSR